MPDIGTLIEARVQRPQAIAEAAAGRRRPTSFFGDHGKLMIIAADHPARGALRAGGDAMAMANRADLLDRLCTALARPGVNGVLGTPDILEDLLLLGVLDDKVVIGSMNRGGLAGTAFEIDDRFTAYDGDSIAAAGFAGGKMLLRIDPDDAGTVATLQSCGRAVSDLAGHRLMAMVEPFISHRVDGRVRNDLSTEAVVRSVAVAAALGTTSAYTWLKLPVIEDMEQVAAASTLPLLLLGGEANVEDPETFERWHRALKLPTVQGMVVGRALLYPADGDVAGAVDKTVELL
jgi:hypothetical protein